jgi:hypothetical protein
VANQVWTYARLLAMLQSELTPADLTLSLFSNNVTPDKNSVFADFTIAVDPVTMLDLTWTLPMGSWSFATDSNGDVASQPQIAQVINGALDVYGYFVYDAGHVLKYAQRFTPAPVSFPSGPNAAILTPVVHGDSP